MLAAAVKNLVAIDVVDIELFEFNQQKLGSSTHVAAIQAYKRNGFSVRYEGDSEMEMWITEDVWALASG
jgi:hypothetical protein